MENSEQPQSQVDLRKVWDNFREWWGQRTSLFKKIIVGFVVSLVVLITIGVATGGQGTPEEEFLSNLDVSSQARETYSDYQFVALGYEVCNYESYGYSGAYVNRVVVDETGLSYSDVGAINLTADAQGLCRNLPS